MGTSGRSLAVNGDGVVRPANVRALTVEMIHAFGSLYNRSIEAGARDVPPDRRYSYSCMLLNTRTRTSTLYTGRRASPRYVPYEYCTRVDQKIQIEHDRGYTVSCGLWAT